MANREIPTSRKLCAARCSRIALHRLLDLVRGSCTARFSPRLASDLAARSQRKRTLAFRDLSAGLREFGFRDRLGRGLAVHSVWEKPPAGTMKRMLRGCTGAIRFAGVGVARHERAAAQVAVGQHRRLASITWIAVRKTMVHPTRPAGGSRAD